MNAGRVRRLRRRDGIGERLLQHVMGRLEAGSLSVHTPGGGVLVHLGGADGPHATIVLHRWRTLWRLLLGGDVAFAEAYIDGDWSSPDLATLIALAARNTEALGSRVMGLSAVRWLHRRFHAARSNTRHQARANIAAHYDLGNDFYASWLDPSMSYSSGLYASPAATLEEAQAAKQDRVIALLDIQGGESVLEIGCGWGALAARLAAERGADVTAITLSAAQLGAASGAVAGTNAVVKLQDYRDVTGTFDRIVSIEMLEAVGEAFWPTYFKVLHDRLAPGGRAVLQVITIEAARYAGYKRSPDFIQRYIFPGGMLPTVPILHDQIRGAALQLLSEARFGGCYARTLADWGHRFQRAWPNLAADFDMRFRRSWEYYLAYCEAGFRQGAIDVGLYCIERPL